MQVQREIKIHKSLKHDNIVKMYAAFQDASSIYLVQEYVSGSSLSKQRADAGGYLSEQVVAREVVKPLLSALKYLHDQVRRIAL